MLKIFDISNLNDFIKSRARNLNNTKLDKIERISKNVKMTFMLIRLNESL